CVAAYFLWYSKREAWQMMKQYKWLSEQSQVELRPDGLFWTTPTGSAIVPWDHLYGWREGQSLFLVYMTPDLYHLVPKRWFASANDVDTFRTALNSNVKPL
ncbi:MAG TPA: YcxB family protein, partial [Thermoanaerobaculia bacterium]